jgi:hypothetical protein
MANKSSHFIHGGWLVVVGLEIVSTVMGTSRWCKRIYLIIPHQQYMKVKKRTHWFRWNWRSSRRLKTNGFDRWLKAGNIISSHAGSFLLAEISEEHSCAVQELRAHGPGSPSGKTKSSGLLDLAKPGRHPQL